ncbi:hypothetical protein ASD92_07505 [Massilia sp. Root1485]|nr:hypothetical protein ASD92_07505 [Massilia sp. Root1485]
MLLRRYEILHLFVLQSRLHLFDKRTLHSSPFTIKRWQFAGKSFDLFGKVDIAFVTKVGGITREFFQHIASARRHRNFPRLELGVSLAQVFRRFGEASRLGRRNVAAFPDVIFGAAPTLERHTAFRSGCGVRLDTARTQFGRERLAPDSQGRFADMKAMPVFVFGAHDHMHMRMRRWIIARVGLGCMQRHDVLAPGKVLLCESLHCLEQPVRVGLGWHREDDVEGMMQGRAALVVGALQVEVPGRMNIPDAVFAVQAFAVLVDRGE